MGAELNDTLPNLPKRFTPRKLHIEATVSGEKVRKSLVIPDPAFAAYKAEASVVVTIDAINFGTTGRTGEQFSFGRNPTGVAAL